MIASASATAFFVNHATSPCSVCSLISRRSSTVSDSYEGLPHGFERIYATELGSVQIIYGIGWRLTGRGPLQTGGGLTFVSDPCRRSCRSNRCDPSIKCQTSNFKDRNLISRPLDGVPARPRRGLRTASVARRSFFDFSITGCHLVSCLKHLPTARKPNSPLQLRRAFPPPSGREPPECPVSRPGGGRRTP